MKTLLLAVVGVILTVYRWLLPSSKWVRKREEYRFSLKEIENELDEVTFKIVMAKKRGDIAAGAPLDIRREQLLKARRDCESEFNYYERLADKSR